MTYPKNLSEEHPTYPPTDVCAAYYSYTDFDTGCAGRNFLDVFPMP